MKSTSPVPFVTALVLDCINYNLTYRADKICVTAIKIQACFVHLKKWIFSSVFIAYKLVCS